MGKIKKILENELVGGTQSTDIYPVTSIKAVYDENNERLDRILNRRGVVNISTNYNNDHIAEVLTLGQAIAKVPSSDRVLGFSGAFLSADGWVTYIFNGESVAEWGDTTKWNKALYANDVLQELGNSTTSPISQKVVSDHIKAIHSLLALKSSFKDGYYWADLDNDNVVVGDNTYDSLSRIEAIPVKEGEEWMLSTSGIGKGYRYFIVDSDYNIITNSNDKNFSTSLIKIPQSASWLLVNCVTSDKDKFRIFNTTLYNTYLEDLAKFKSYRLVLENAAFSGGTKLEKTGNGIYRYGQGINDSPGYVADNYTYFRYTADKLTTIGIITPSVSGKGEYRNLAIFDTYGNLVYQANLGLKYYVIPLAKGYTLEASASEVYIGVTQEGALQDEVHALQDEVHLTIVEDKYWADAQNTGKVSGAYTYSTLSRAEPIAVTKGDKFFIKCKGIAKGYSYYIVDSEYNTLFTTGNDKEVALEVTIEQDNAAFLLVNSADNTELVVIRIQNGLVSSGLYYTMRNIETQLETQLETQFETLEVSETQLEAYTGIEVDLQVSLNWVNGYIHADTGVINDTYSPNNTYKKTYIPVTLLKGEYYYTGVFEGKGGVAFYDKDDIFISGYSDNSKRNPLEVPDGATYMRLTSYSANGDHSGATLVRRVYKEGNIQRLIKRAGLSLEEMSVEWKDGYIDYTNGNRGSLYGDGLYRKVEDYIKIEEGKTYITNCHFLYKAGIAFYNASHTFISGYNVDSEIINIPESAAYFCISNYRNSTDDEDAKIWVSQEGELGKKIRDIENKITEQSITVNCIGDSVTEGMSTNGNHTSEYGKDPYPAQLYTLLVDNGYNNVQVVNCGHGGERLQDVAVRSGGIGCYITEDITIPKDNSKVALGEKVVQNNKIKGTKLALYFPDQDGNDYNVYLTQTSHDTNPCTIDGVKYTMSIDSTHNYIQKVENDGKETVIPKGSLFFTANNRNADVNIIYIGINGSQSLTLEKWLEVNKRCGLVNGGKYIILGCTHSLWNNWSDVEGGSSDEKYVYYRRKCFETFGVHFIDLYDEFFRHAMEYCLEKGYFSDKSEEDIAAMKELLAAHTIPKEFSYDGNHQGDVHLSKEGYYVIGKLLFDRFKVLNYLVK